MKIDPRIQKILISENELEVGVSKAAAYINEKYANNKKPIILVGILKGCIPFIGKLLPQIKVDVELDFLVAKSYYGGMESTGNVKIVTDLKNDIADRDVVLIEDIIDTANTLNTIVKILKSRNPKSLKLVCLLDKPGQRKYDIKADFVCFTIPQVFVVGFGLDFQEIMRNFPFIGVLKPEVYKYLNKKMIN